MQPRSLLSVVPEKRVSGCGGQVMEGKKLTACAVERVFALRDGEIGLPDAVLAVVQLTDAAVGTLGGSTVGGEGELAAKSQHEVMVRSRGGRWEGQARRGM